METGTNRFDQFSRQERGLILDSLYTEWDACRRDIELNEYCDKLYKLIGELKKSNESNSRFGNMREQLRTK